ncbi:MAG: alpha/beta hydrolase [Marmoricola sp.]|jgi:pimeloyl-ACP methyl ester carboxylesterase|nr:alpha/beta hydrolase [Marmoricola sp.]
MTSPESHTLEVHGASLGYDVRGDLPSVDTVLLMIGSPMGAEGFTSLAGHFTDRTVVTYDPHGVGRSQRSDGRSETTPADHADDLHLLIEALGAGPVDVFASSGGAVNGLALVAAHPEQVRTLVAHEPPLADQLPDREQVIAACEGIHATYQKLGQGPAMAKFLAVVMHQGEFPETYGEQPSPDPAAFGLPTEDDGSRNDPLLGQNIRTCTSYVPDYEALATASTRVVIAYGEESGEGLAARGGRGVARRLGLEPVAFPSDHGGFLGGEFGQHGDPDAFGPRLREVLGY